MNRKRSQKKVFEICDEKNFFVHPIKKLTQGPEWSATCQNFDFPGGPRTRRQLECCPEGP